MTAVIGNEPVDGQTLELKAETLVVTKRMVTGATVRVSTVTREVEQAIDERLDHDLVDVERVFIGRVVEAIPEIREEDGVTIVPVVEEVVVVERHQPACPGRLDNGHVALDYAGARAGLLGEPVRRRAGP